jgi:TPR repeat protein
MGGNPNEYERYCSRERLVLVRRKLLWGYEGVEKDYDEAFKLFRQAADLGFSDAHLRVAQLHKYGKGDRARLERSPGELSDCRRGR